MKPSIALMPQPFATIPELSQMQPMMGPDIQKTYLGPSSTQRLAFQTLIGSQSAHQSPPLKFPAKSLSVHLSIQRLFNHYSEVLKLDPRACHQWFMTHNDWKSLLHSSFRLNTHQGPIQCTLAGLALVHKQFSVLELCM